MINKFELKLVKKKSYMISKKITCSDDAFYLFERIFELSTKPEETLTMLATDSIGNCIGAFELSRGTTRSSIIGYAEVIKRLLLSNATGFIIAHNHPSGNISPSKEDIKATEELNQISKIFGFILMDSLIICDKKFYSMNREGDVLFDTKNH